MKYKLSIIIFTLFIAFSLLKAEENEFQEIKKKVDKLYYSFDSKKLINTLNQIQMMKRKNPNKWQYDYYSAVLCNQIGKILYLPKPDDAYNYFDRSLDYLFKVKKVHNDEEILALISATYGKMSSLSTIKAIYYGLKAKDYIYTAAKIDSNNSKVLLVASIHLMHTPESFGGDKEWAEELLKRALKLLYKENQKENDISIEWAKDAEIYAYLAQLEILKKNKIKAELYIDKALKLIPDYGFVLKDLIPQLEEIK
jgi:hypothetical protein